MTMRMVACSPWTIRSQASRKMVDPDLTITAIVHVRQGNPAGEQKDTVEMDWDPNVGI